MSSHTVLCFKVLQLKIQTVPNPISDENMPKNVIHTAHTDKIPAAEQDMEAQYKEPGRTVHTS